MAAYGRIGETIKENAQDYGLICNRYENILSCRDDIRRINTTFVGIQRFQPNINPYNMTPDFDYSEVPFGFNYCLNKSCKQASTCLRYRLYTHIPAACQTIRIINPVYAATIDDVCPFFMPDKKVRYALGITHLLDHVPYSDAVSIKRQMLAHFKQATYYRCRRKERMLDPSEQEYIRKLFVSKGIKELPVYDEYIEKYDW